MTDARPPPGQIVIAGGGIGGLAAALALARQNIPSEVLERRPAFGEDGAGIQIGPNGTRILTALGVAPMLEASVTTPDAVHIRDAMSGRDLARFPLGPWIAERHGAPYWTLHRRDLHKALLDTARREPLIRIRTDVVVTALREERDESVTAVAADGEASRGRALIAADGAWSALRTDPFGGGAPRYTGKCAVRTVLPVSAVPEPLRRPEVNLWIGPDVHVVHYPVSGGEAVALVAIFDDGRVAGDWNSPCDRGWVGARRQRFAPLLKDLVGRPDTWRRWSLLALETSPQFSVGRMALLGDAAHPVLPFLAQGGVMALEDAVVVARALAADPQDPARALEAYARERTPRVRRVAEASRANGRIYHMEGVMAAGRNMALRHIPPERFMSRYDWLYGWALPA
ncbi:FAD-binding monooxygenase [Hyphomicrobium nitrativorans NL23]|uniref:FAD-binding monooxygenase n=1 Tax=Hyphomicrobium nitrativorans NL23 TaxID=1029756 RepID=V5SGH7_9HYPH|nr:FAD-dependent monooxygenase [Hyphomicrobium nitrativorans]AHB49638.1 FAD-binding monooxygenase [Hyphomicrobium nitrativorans NL23]